jgi:hypothetical protein
LKALTFKALPIKYFESVNFSKALTIPKVNYLTPYFVNYHDRRHLLSYQHHPFSSLCPYETKFSRNETKFLRNEAKFRFNFCSAKRKETKISHIFVLRNKRNFRETGEAFVSFRVSRNLKKAKIKNPSCHSRYVQY